MRNVALATSYPHPQKKETTKYMKYTKKDKSISRNQQIQSSFSFVFFFLSCISCISWFNVLFHLRDDLFQLLGHRWDRCFLDLHLAAGALADDHVDAAEVIALVGVVVTQVPAPPLLAVERRARDGLRHGQQVGQVQRRVPS